MSQSTHSTRVEERIAQRSSVWIPRARRPHAMFLARRPAVFQSMVFQSLPTL